MSDSKKVKFEGPKFKIKLKLSVKPGKSKDAKPERSVKASHEKE